MGGGEKPPNRVVVIVGAPEHLRAAMERSLPHLTVRFIFSRRDPPWLLALPEQLVLSTIETHVDEAGYENSMIVLLPYVKIPRSVLETLDILAECGSRVIRAEPGVDPWPTRPAKMDGQFREALAAAVRSVILLHWPPPASVASADESVAFEVLRALVTHSKMGPNNHSHEDDLWKGKDENLRPRDRNRIEQRLMTLGILDRKKNQSLGGTGWVYWIADVGKACEHYPQLSAFLAGRQ